MKVTTGMGVSAVMIAASLLLISISFTQAYGMSAGILTILGAALWAAVVASWANNVSKNYTAYKDQIKIYRELIQQERAKKTQHLHTMSISEDAETLIVQVHPDTLRYETRPEFERYIEDIRDALWAYDGVTITRIPRTEDKMILVKR